MNWKIDRRRRCGGRAGNFGGLEIDEIDEIARIDRRTTPDNDQYATLHRIHMRQQASKILFFLIRGASLSCQRKPCIVALICNASCICTDIFMYESNSPTFGSQGNQATSEYLREPKHSDILNRLMFWNWNFKVDLVSANILVALKLDLVFEKIWSTFL